jgi:hypothetical protein
VSRVDIVSTVNRRIYDFVCERANKNLLPGTGHYSTPFRGGLFGQVESAAVMNYCPGAVWMFCGWGRILAFHDRWTTSRVLPRAEATSLGSKCR